MPGFDGTGPRGMGPMTGGGRGFCSPWGMRVPLRGGPIPPYPRVPYAPYGGPGATPYYGGYAPGAFMGMIPGAPTAPGMTPSAPQAAPQQELDYLKNQAQMMREQLERIEARIQELGEE